MSISFFFYETINVAITITHTHSLGMVFIHSVGPTRHKTSAQATQCVSLGSQTPPAPSPTCSTLGRLYFFACGPSILTHHPQPPPPIPPLFQISQSISFPGNSIVLFFLLVVFTRVLAFKALFPLCQYT